MSWDSPQFKRRSGSRIHTLDGLPRGDLQSPVDQLPDLRYASAVHRERLDLVLVARGLAESRSAAQKLILAGEVFVGASRADKPSVLVADDACIHIRQKLPFVSRGGRKLQAALEAFEIEATGLVCADVGASTGGFTDCLLQHGAARVYAIDVGYGQLDWKLRRDSRVVVLERTNARYLNSLPEPIALAVIDVSFISLTLIFPAVMDWLAAEGQVVSLVKPQFEAGREQVGKGGVVRDTAIHADVLQRVLNWANVRGLTPLGVTRSPITGPAGNVEFLAYLRRGVASREANEINAMLTACISGSSSPH